MEYYENENIPACGFSGKVWQTNGYGSVHRAVMTNPAISFGAKALYAYFMSFTGEKDLAYPALKTILKDLHITKTTYYKYRHELEALGIIFVVSLPTSMDVINDPKGWKTFFYMCDKPVTTEEEANWVIDQCNAISGFPAHRPCAQHSPLVPTVVPGDTGIPKICESSNAADSSSPKTAGQTLSPKIYESKTDSPLDSQNMNHASPNFRNPLLHKNNNNRTESIYKAVEPPMEPQAAPADAAAEPPMDGFVLSEEEEKAFAQLCRMSMRDVSASDREDAHASYAEYIADGYTPSQILRAYERYEEEYRQTNDTPRYAKKLSAWFGSEKMRFHLGTPKVVSSSPALAEPVVLTPEQAEEREKEEMYQLDDEYRQLCDEIHALYPQWAIAKVKSDPNADSFCTRIDALKTQRDEYFAQHRKVTA